MKLRNLECNNCGSPLKQDEGKLVCEYCGGVFDIPKDSSDVAFEKIANAEEYIRINLQRSKLALERKYKNLEEQSKTKKEQDYQNTVVRRRKANTSAIIKMVVMMLIIFVGMAALISVCIKNSNRRNAEKKEKETQAALVWKPGYRLTPSDLGEDFLNEFDEAVIAKAQGDHDKTYEDDNEVNWEATDYEIIDTYFVTDDDKNVLSAIVQITFTSESGETKDMYKMYCQKNITVDSSRKIDTEINLYSEESSTNENYWDCDSDLQVLIDETVNAWWRDENRGCLKFTV